MGIVELSFGRNKLLIVGCKSPFVTSIVDNEELLSTATVSPLNTIFISICRNITPSQFGQGDFAVLMKEKLSYPSFSTGDLIQENSGRSDSGSAGPRAFFLSIPLYSYVKTGTLNSREAQYVVVSSKAGESCASACARTSVRPLEKVTDGASQGTLVRCSVLYGPS